MSSYVRSHRTAVCECGNRIKLLSTFDRVQGWHLQTENAQLQISEVDPWKGPTIICNRCNRKHTLDELTRFVLIWDDHLNCGYPERYFDECPSLDIAFRMWYVKDEAGTGSPLMVIDTQELKTYSESDFEEWYKTNDLPMP